MDPIPFSIGSFTLVNSCCSRYWRTLKQTLKLAVEKVQRAHSQLRGDLRALSAAITDFEPKTRLSTHLVLTADQIQECIHELERFTVSTNFFASISFLPQFSSAVHWIRRSEYSLQTTSYTILALLFSSISGLPRRHRSNSWRRKFSSIQTQKQNINNSTEDSKP